MRDGEERRGERKRNERKKPHDATSYKWSDWPCRAPSQTGGSRISQGWNRRGALFPQGSVRTVTSIKPSVAVTISQVLQLQFTFEEINNPLKSCTSQPAGCAGFSLLFITDSFSCFIVLQRHFFPSALCISHISLIFVCCFLLCTTSGVFLMRLPQSHAGLAGCIWGASTAHHPSKYTAVVKRK